MMPIARDSFIELGARERARVLLDPGTFRELLGPFDHIESPWLAMQGIVCQADDGVVIAQGRIGGEPAVIAAIESAFQGGSIGEVAGSKIAAALEFALRSCERGRRMRAVLLFETGGVRLQEANLGLAVIAEIHAAIVALRRHVPVVGVIAGMVGCFGGMSLGAALCSRLVMTRQARLGMNGPEVIEQEAGIAELDSTDRRLVWSLIGGEQRVATGLADVLVDDDADEIRAAVAAAFEQGMPSEHRSEQVERYLSRLERVDPARIDPAMMRVIWGAGQAGAQGRDSAPSAKSAVPVSGGPVVAGAGETTLSVSGNPSRGARWLDALAGTRSAGAPVRYVDAMLGGEAARLIAVVPDPDNRFPRATDNVIGLEQGWRLAQCVRDAVAADAGAATKRPIVAIVDVKSQAYGRREEMLGIHLACAAAVDAYAGARLAGHPVIALLVGPAMSGAFLAHGYQANRIIALDAPGVIVHAMGKEAAARVTRRSVDALDELADKIVPMSYSIGAFARLGLVDRLIEGIDADSPDDAQLAAVRATLADAIADARMGPRDLSHRLQSDSARNTRAGSIAVRERMREQWRDDGAA